jgi:hypothetical protein
MAQARDQATHAYTNQRLWANALKRWRRENVKTVSNGFANTF